MLKTLLISIFLITSCSNLKVRTADRSKSTPQKTESVDQTEILKPEKPKVYNIAIIIGPGGAKTMGSAGVLKLLADEDINIKYVSGLGWGALPAAIFANNLKPHELEWQFYKLKKMSLRSKNFMGSIRDYLDPNKVENYTKQIFASKKIQDFKLAFACPVKLKGSDSTTLKLSDQATKGLMMCLDHPPLFKRADHHTGAALSYGPLAEHFESKDINFIIYIDSLSSLTVEDLSKVKLGSKDKAYWQRLLKLNKHYSEHSDFTFTVDAGNYDLFGFNQASGLISQGEQAAKSQFKSLVKKLKE